MLVLSCCKVFCYNSAKIMQTESKISSLLEYYAEVQLILCKDTIILWGVVVDAGKML